MKKVLLVIFCGLSNFYSFSQDTPAAFATRINYIFQYIDQSQVSTGMLQEYGIDFTNINNYNGSVLNDSNKVAIDEWRNLYASLYSSQINSSPNLAGLAVVNSNIKSYTDNSLAVLHYNFNSIRSDAISSNLLSASGDQLYDVLPRNESPYQQETAFAISPAKGYFSAEDEHSFIFRQSMFYSNTGKTVSALYLDDGNGYVQAYWDTAFYFDFSSPGANTVKAKIIYTDSSVFESHFIIYTEEPVFSLFDYTDLPDVPIIATRVHLGSAASGTIQIRISEQNNGLIKKPLIIAESFDASFFLGINTNFDVTDFLFDISNLANYDLEDELDIAGYDIIYLDYSNGTDYIENNAYLLQDVIKWVNAQKALNNSTEQNVVLGQSMGGLVARWALKDMEDRSEAHDVRLNISMDSPHNGAYVPLSVQALLTGIHDFEIGLGLLGINPVTVFELSEYTQPIIDVFTSPAAKQMLIYHLDYTGSSFYEDNSVYSTFMTSYHSKGIPANCQNMAISNGSSCGTLQETLPGSYYVNINENSRLDYGQKFGIFLLSAVFGTFSAPKFLISGVLGILPNKTSLSTAIKLRALGNNQDLEIYNAQIGVKRKILGLIDVNTYLINQSFNSGSRLPVDSAPGGKYDLNIFGLGSLSPSFSSYIIQTASSFVPTVSSLDLSTNFSNFSYSDLTYAYRSDNIGSYPKSTPFSAVKTGYEDNELHIDFTRPNSEWFYSKLENTSVAVPCISFCTEIAISGPSSFCTSEIYSIPGLPTGSSVSWSASFNITIVSSSGNSVTIQPLSSSTSGTGTITATVTSPCGNFVVTKDQIIVGGPVPIISDVSELTPICPQQMQYAYNNDSSDGYYSWHVTGGTIVSGQGTSTVGFYADPLVWPNTSSTLGLTLTIHGACGNDLVKGMSLQVNDCSGGGTGNRWQIYPNPAAEELTVKYHIEHEESKIIQTMTTPLFEVKLLDEKGKLLRSGKSGNGEESISLNTAEVPDGRYFLHISSEKKTEKRQVIIKH